jgi:uncharacterized 2Fe-2S/4Fe-4S cluster protein (DUF4445 family)
LSATLVFEPDGRRVSAKTGVTLMEVAQQARVAINTECGGKGTCGKCRVIVKDQGNVSEVTETEKSHLTTEELAQGYRLACQTTILGDIAIYLPRISTGQRRIQVGGFERNVAVKPLVGRYVIELEPPTLENPLADADRLLVALRTRAGVEIESVRVSLLKRLPKVLRDSGWRVTVTTWDREVIDVQGSDAGDSYYGLAVDIGTSKLALLLVDLQSGSTVSVESVENPQIVHGEDVYTRMTYALEGSKNAEELTHLIVQSINSLITEFERKARIDGGEVYEVTVVGNTAMHHLFLGLPTRSLAFSPFVPAIRRGMNVDAQSLGLRINPEGNVYAFPVIAGFVGGDAVADILTTGIYEADELSMLVDIGTNTELCLGNKDDLLCCSCASGPAFEGYHITHGVKAVSGAIEKIQIDPESFKATYSTVNGDRPIGICGSGMIDALAEMRRARLIGPDGRFNPELGERFHRREGMLEFTIVPASDSATGSEIVLTQKDVRELQLAKAAIFTGCKALMEEKKVSPEDVESLYVAGAFGNYLNLRNAIAIGMLPPISEERFKLVGNSAVAGAKLGLISSEMRRKAETIAQRTRYLELGARKTFNRDFTSALDFPKTL